MPELGKATYVIEIDSRDFEKKLKSLKRVTTSNAKDQDRAIRDMADAWSTVQGDVKRTTSEVDKNTGSVDRNRRSVRGWGSDVVRLNQGLSLLGKTLKLAKIPAFTAAIGFAIQAVSALAGGVVALVGALGPLVGILGTLPGLISAVGQGFGTALLAFGPIVSALKEMATAHKAAGGAAGVNAKAQKAAAVAVVKAEKELEKAHKGVTKAVQELSVARREARRELQDMRLASEGDQLSEKRAKLAAQAARKALVSAEASGKATSGELKDLRLSLEEAELGVRESRLTNKRATEELGRAEVKGVHNSETMKAAREGVHSAQESVVSSTENLSQALERETEAAKGGTTANASLAAKMKELSPEAQRFAKYLYSLKGNLKALSASAGRKMFPGVETGIKSALKLFPSLNKIVERTGGVIGNVAERFGKLLGSSAFGSRFKKIGNDNVKTIERFGTAGIKVFDGLSHVMVAARPLVDWITKLTVQFGKWFDAEAAAGQKSGKLAKYFEHTKETMTVLGHTFKYLWEGLAGIFRASKPLGEWLLKSFESGAKALSEWSNSVSGKKSLTKYFEGLKPTLTAIWRLFHDVVIDFFKLGEAKHGQGGFPALLEMIRKEALPAIFKFIKITTNTFGPVLVHALTKIVELAAVFVGTSGPLQVMVHVLGEMAGFIKKVVTSSPVVQDTFVTIFATMALVKGIKWASAVSGIQSLIGWMGKLKAAAVGAATAEEATSMGGVTGALAKRGGVRGIVKNRRAAGATASASSTGIKSAAAAPGAELGLGALSGGAEAGVSTGGATVAEAETGPVASLAASAPEVAAVAAAILAIGAGLFLLYKHSKSFRDAIKPLTDAAAAGFKEVKKSVNELAHAFDGELAKSVSELLHVVAPALKWLAKAFGVVLVGAIKQSATLIGGQLRGITMILSGAIDTWRGIIEVFTGLIHGDFGKVWEGVKTIFKGSLKEILGILTMAIAPLKGVFAVWDTVFSAAFDGIWEGIKNTFKNGLNDVIDMLNTFIGIVNVIPGISIGKIGHIGEGPGKGHGGGVEMRHRSGKWLSRGTKSGNNGINASESARGRQRAYARGGFINEGVSGRDSVPALLERNEYVLNKNAVEAAGGPRALDAFNFGAAPRHGKSRMQKGGVAHMSIGGEALGALGSVANGLTGGIAGDVLKGVSSAAKSALTSLPNPADLLPKFFQPFGDYMKNALVSWVAGESPATGQGGVGAVDLSGVKGSVAKQAAQISKRANSPQRATLALFEALWAESTMGSAAPGNVLQALEPYTKVRPAAQEIAGFLTGHPTWTGVSAIAQARHNPSEHAYEIAQDVQKSGAGEASHGASNYGAQREAALSTMAQFGLRRGGRPGSKWGRSAGNFHSLPGAGATGVEGKLGGQDPWERRAGKGRRRRRMAGGGYVFPFKNANYSWGRVDQGVDFTGSGPISAIGDGQVLGMVPPEWPEGGGLYYKLTDGPKSGTEIYVYEGVKAMLSAGASFKAGDTIAKFSGSSIETGFASGAGSTAAQVAGDVNPSSHYSSEGQAMYGFLKMLEGGKGWAGNAASSKSGPSPGTPGALKKPPLPKGFDVKGIPTISASGEGEKYVSTTPLNLNGAIPHSVPGITKELQFRRLQLSWYQRGVRQAPSKRMKEALLANVKVIKKRIQILVKARAKLISEKKIGRARKNISEEGDFETWTKRLEATAKAWEQREESAGQVTELEPSEEAAAKQYIEGSEAPAYRSILELENQWRNQLIGAEGAAGTKIGGWEGQAAQITKRIHAIKALHQSNPAAWRKQRGELPVLEAKRDEIHKQIKRTKTETIPGWEEQLGEVQGPFAAAAHNATAFKDLLGAAANPTPGQWGGDIWSTITTLRDLGIRLSETSEGSAEGESGLAELYKQLATQARQREGVLRLELPNFNALRGKVGGGGPTPAYGGIFHQGGVVPGPPGASRSIIAQSGEVFIQPGDLATATAGDVRPHATVIIEDGAVNADAIRVVWDEKASESASKTRRRIGGR